MGKIIGISGRKQAGKNTVANYINGHILKSKQMIHDFYISDNGELAIKTFDHNGKLDYGILDITRKDKTFVEYAELDLWPYVKVYSFADQLKNICINVFGMSHQQVYGTNEQKDTETNIEWKNVPNSKRKKGNITAREFMQHFGTNIVRKMKDDAWVQSCMKNILAEDSEVSLIPDVRFPNEVKAIKEAGGIVIRLTRDVYNSNHDSEKALNKETFDWDNFDIVIDNANSSLSDLCEIIESHKKIWS